MSPDDPSFETIPVADPLRARIAMRADADPDSLFEAADNAIAEQARHYLDRARAELAEAAAAIGAALAGGDGSGAALDVLYRIAHDMKGQAATFGYPLATEIAALLCVLLTPRAGLDEAALRVAEAHVNGLIVVMENELRGDGGALGRELVERLRGLGERVRA